MNIPKVTVTLDPLKGPILNLEGIDDLGGAMILQGAAMNLLARAIRSKEDKRILTPV